MGARQYIYYNGELHEIGGVSQLMKILPNIYIKCPCCGQVYPITEQFCQIVDSLVETRVKEEQEKAQESKWPRTDWDESLVKLKFDSPDWDD
jgi:hypothetical protein